VRARRKVSLASCVKGHERIVQLLLENRPDTDLARHNQTVVERLLEMGATYKTTADNGITL
jgi:hypothetical protein